MKLASGFAKKDFAMLHPETPVKRASYVRCVVQLLCRCSHLKEVEPSAFGIIMTNLLTEMETVVGTVLDPASQHQEAIALSSEILNFLNNCNPQSPATSVALTTIMDWVESSPTSILLLPLVTASCRTLASVSHMSHIIEACIDAHFNAGMLWFIENVSSYIIFKFIICLLPGHRFYYGNSYTKICAIFMPICTENRFCFLHCDWLDLIPLFYHLITQFQDPHSLITTQTYVNNAIFTALSICWSANVKSIKVHNFRD